MEQKIIIQVIQTLFSLWPIILFAIGFALVKSWLTQSDRSKTGSLPSRYVSRKFLLSDAEAQFHSSLQSAVGHQYWICPKVRLSDIVEPDPALNRPGNQTARNQISQKHIDFVLCNPGDFRIVAVVELDDSSHRRSDRQGRDAFVDDALGQAGVPILHVPWAKSYSAEDLAGKIHAILSP